MARDYNRYTPRGTTWKPCPACGEEPQSAYRIGSVCGDCRNLLEWARHEKQRFSKLQGLQIRTLPSHPDRIRLGYCPGGGSSQAPHQKDFSAAEREVSLGVYALLEVLSLATGGAAEIAYENRREGFDYSRRSIPHNHDGGGYHEDEHHRRLLIHSEFADLIDRLGPNIGIMLQCAYESGLIDGKGLLSQLAKGAITLDTLSEADQRVARSIQDAVIRRDNMK